MRREPRDPLNTAMTVRPAGRASAAHAAARSGAAAAAAISGRNGLPVTTAFGRSVPANDTALALANRRSTRLTAPARAFCSTSTSGTRHSTAPTPQAKLA